MAATQSSLEAKRLVDKYGRESAIGIARQRSLHALDMANDLLTKERAAYWKSEFSFWNEVREAIEKHDQ